MSQQSAPFKTDEMLYLKHATKWEIPGHFGFRQIDARLGCITGHTEVAELHVKLLLRGIAATVKGDDDYYSWSAVQPIGRIEIFCDDHTEGARHRLQDRGIVLFDVHNRPLVHVLHALIGYGGSGPSLTEAILREIGVDESIFDQIQEAHAGIRSTNTPYYVVVQKVDDHWVWSSVTK